MESPIGKVLAVEPPDITIEVRVAAICQRCANGKGCGAGLLGGEKGVRRVEVPLPEGLQLFPGDRVILELGSRNLLRAATLAYGLPLAAVMVTLMVGNIVAGSLSEATSMMLAAAGLAVGLGISRWQLARSCAQDIVPRIRAIAPIAAANAEIKYE